LTKKQLKLNLQTKPLTNI